MPSQEIQISSPLDFEWFLQVVRMDKWMGGWMDG